MPEPRYFTSSASLRDMLAITPSPFTEDQRASMRAELERRGESTEEGVTIREQIAAEIEAERLDANPDDIGAAAYINGLLMAEQIVRNGR